MLKNVLNFKWLQVVFFAGCATGAVAGAIAGMGMGFGAGLLLAQKPGKDLRDDLADKTLDLYDDVKSKAGQAKDRLDNFVSPRRTDNGQFDGSNN
ncbi:MAG TPA: YtxH domain-containing protein [Drouetiella sp.]